MNHNVAGDDSDYNTRNNTAAGARPGNLSTPGAAPMNSVPAERPLSNANDVDQACECGGPWLCLSPCAKRVEREEAAQEGNALRVAAAELLAAGFSVIPIRADGSKVTSLRSWNPYREHLSTPAEHDRWFAPGKETGLAVVCGKVSGNVLMIELEGEAVENGWTDRIAQTMQDAGLGAAWAQLTTGWAEQSPSGGIHYHVRVNGGPCPKNTKLIQRPAVEGDRDKDGTQVPLGRPVVLAETRGEGGYAVRAPSRGKVHACGKPYVRLTGSPAAVPVMDHETVQALLDTLKSLDAMPAREAAGKHPAARHEVPEGHLSPVDDFNRRVDWGDLLAGRFTFLYERDGEGMWRREGKSAGLSATTNYQGTGKLHVFTTSTDLPANESMSAFYVYAHLRHDGDMSAAAKALAGRGYGDRLPERRTQASVAAEYSERPRITVDLDHLTDLDPAALADDGPVSQEERDLLARLAEIRLPDHFWLAPHMQKIAQAADAVGVKREGLLALLNNRARVLAGTEIEGQFNEKGAFYLAGYHALVGRSGSGSNVTRRAVERLLPLTEACTAVPPTEMTQAEAEAWDWGFSSLIPPTGSSLVAHAQRPVKVATGEVNDKTGEDIREIRYFPIPRLHAHYTEGAQLLSTLSKSASAASQGAALENLLLEAFVGDELRADLADKSARPPVPARSYALGIDAYFQAEIIGQALARTTGLAQRFMYVPILMPKAPQRFLDLGGRLANGGYLTPEERAEMEALHADLPDRPAFPEPMTDVVNSLDASARGVAPDVEGPKERMRMCERMRKDLGIITASIEGGAGQDDPLITHRGMNLFRFAAGQALLRCSREISEDDWDLARAMVAVGEETKRVCRAWGELQAEMEQREDNAKAASRTLAQEGARAVANGTVSPVVRRVAGKMESKVRKGECSTTDLATAANGRDVGDWKAIGGEDGKKGLVERALQFAVGGGLIVPQGVTRKGTPTYALKQG